MELREIRELWLKEAQALPIGGTKRMCNPADPQSRASLIIRNEVQGYSAHDFRHNSNDFVPKEMVFSTSIKEDLTGAKPPDDMQVFAELSTYMQESIAAFLLSKGVTPNMLGRNVLYYSAKTGRIIVKAHTLTSSFYLGRDFTGRSNAKWISYREAPQHNHARFKGRSDTVVLTEDYFSAVKINYATHLTTIALLGTMLYNDVALMCTEYNKVIVWLDGDDAGLRGSLKAVKDLRALVEQVEEINIYGKDPKDLTIKEIKECLQ